MNIYIANCDKDKKDVAELTEDEKFLQQNFQNRSDQDKANTPKRNQGFSMWITLKVNSLHFKHRLFYCGLKGGMY